MKRFSEALGWALFFVLAGVFLLLKNLDVFGPWGELIWGGLFAVAALGFLIWFLTGLQNWWRAIPAFTLLGIGAMLILGWRNVDFGEWRAAIVLFGMALGFWAVLLVRREHWWALLPAGVLTVLGVMLGLWTSLGPQARLAILFLGVGLVFLLLYALRLGDQRARWAAIPAGALLLLGAVTLIQSVTLPPVVAGWWPLALVVAGLVLGVLSLTRTATTVTPAPPMKPPADEDALPPAAGASISALPTVEELAAKNPMPWETPQETKPAGDEPAGDIYDIIKKQPKP